MNYCGIDLASKSSAVRVLNKNGGMIFEQMVATTVADFRAALVGLGHLRCVVEAAPLAEWVVQVLEEQGHEGIIIDPRRAKAVIQTKNKTDKLDARNLAKLAQTGWYTAVHRKSTAARMHRTHLQARQGLVDTAKAQAGRIRGLLRAHGIKVGPVSVGKFVGWVQQVIAEQAPALAPILPPSLRLYEQAQQAAKALARMIRPQVRQDPVCRRLMQVPGVGLLVASTYVATINDPARFARQTQMSHPSG